MGRAVPPAKGNRHRKCLFVFLHGGPVGQAYCVIGSTNFMMSSRSNREQSVLLASDDHGVQEAENIIDKARKTSVVMTETVVQKAEEERHRRQGTARTGSQLTRSGGPPRRRLREGLAGDSGGQPLVSPPPRHVKQRSQEMTKSNVLGLKYATLSLVL